MKGRKRKPEDLAPGKQPKRGKGAEKAREKGAEKMSEWQRFYEEHKNDEDVRALPDQGKRNALIGDKYWASGKPCTKCRNAQNCCTAGRDHRQRARVNLGLAALPAPSAAEA